MTQMARLHIALVEPMDTDLLPTEEAVRLSSARVLVSASSTPGGPQAENSLQSRHNVARAEAALPAAVFNTLVPESDAIVINCLRDPGIAVLRELTDIPVIGLAETAMCVAGILGRTFGVIVNEERGIHVVDEQARLFARSESFTRARAVNIAVDQMSSWRREDVVSAVSEVARTLVEEDQSDVIILGCTAFSPFIAEITAAMAELGHPGIPIIEPTALGVRMAEVLIDLSLTHSRRAYPPSTAYIEQDWRVGGAGLVPTPRV